MAKIPKHRTACALSESLSVHMSKTHPKRPTVSGRDQVRTIFKEDRFFQSLINNLGEFNKHNWHNYYSNSETKRLHTGLTQTHVQYVDITKKNYFYFGFLNYFSLPSPKRDLKL